VVVLDDEGVIELAPRSALNAVEAVFGHIPMHALTSFEVVPPTEHSAKGVVYRERRSALQSSARGVVKALSHTMELDCADLEVVRKTAGSTSVEAVVA
jgi:hypothetical protein